jgi:hypothetical protein
MSFDWANATRDSIRWPAVRFIIKRNDRVKGRKKHLISSTQDMNIAKASAGKFAGVKWEGHQDLVIRELKNGADHNGKANDIVNRNWVVIVKLKGNRPLIFHDNIAKHVNIKGVVSLLKGASAEHNLLITQLLSKLGKLE